MKKQLCTTIADKGCVCMNGICFSCDGDGWKTVILTDEIERNPSRPWIDLRESELFIWRSDCDPGIVYKFDEKELETWAVEIFCDPANDIIYLIKFD